PVGHHRGRTDHAGLRAAGDSREVPEAPPPAGPNRRIALRQTAGPGRRSRRLSSDTPGGVGQTSWSTLGEPLLTFTSPRWRFRDVNVLVNADRARAPATAPGPAIVSARVRRAPATGTRCG